MKLSSNGVLARFYEWSYDYDPPDDLCSFFWLELWALVWLPFSIFSIWSRDSDGLTMRVVGGLVTQIGLFLAAVILYFGVWLHPWNSLWVVGTLVGILFGVALIVIACALVWGFFNDTNMGIEIKSVVRGKKDSVKNKYCPRIEWK